MGRIFLTAFSTDLINKVWKSIKSYFKKFGLDEVVKNKNFKKRKVNQMKDDFAFQPELDELYLLHRYIIQFKRMTILEFGIFFRGTFIDNFSSDQYWWFFEIELVVLASL